MNNKIVSGGGEWRHKRLSILIPAILITLVAVGVLIPLSQSSDDPYAVPTLDKEDISVGIDEGLTTYLDSLPNPSTVDLNSEEFKKYISVTNQTGEKLEFYVYADETLKQGTNTLEIRVFTMGDYDHYSTGEDFVPDQDLVTIDFQKTVTIDKGFSQVPVTSIEVTGYPDTIWSSTSEEEFKKQLTVKATFSDGSSHEILSYNLDWDYRDTSGPQTVTVMYGDSIDISDSFQCTVKEPMPVSITDGDVTVRENNTVHSSDTANDLKGKIRVVATMQDNKKHVLEDTEYGVSDNLYTGAGSLVGTPTPVKLSITIETPSGQKSFGPSINVLPSQPELVDAQIIAGTEFTAFTTPSLSSFSVYVKFTDATRGKDVVDGYSIRYVNNEGKTINYGEEKDSLEAGDYTLFVDYTEAGTTIPCEIGTITVNKIRIAYPGLTAGSLTYTNSFQGWNVTSYTEDVVDAKIDLYVDGVKQSNNGEAQLTNVDGVPRIVAKLEGEYHITFVISDDERAQKSYAFDESEVEVYARYITPGVPVVELSEKWTGWVYGHYTEPSFIAYLSNEQSGESIPVAEGDINWNLVDVEYFKDPGFENEIGDCKSLEVGTYYIRVTVPEKACVNLQGTKSAALEFDVTKNTIEASIDTSRDYTYTGDSENPLRPFIIIRDVQGEVILEDITKCYAKEIDAGTYDITVELTDTKNYQWIEGANKLKWTITPKSISYPSVGNDTVTYNGAEQNWTVSNTEGTVFDDGNFDVSVTCTVGNDPDDDMKFSIDGETQNIFTAKNAGIYTITFDIKSNSNGDGNYNYKWDGAESPITITISLAKLTVTGTQGISLVYGDTEPTFTMDNLVIAGWLGTDGNDPDSHIVIGTIDSEYDAGDKPDTYYLTIGNIESRNYHIEESSEISFEVQRAPITIIGMSHENVKVGSPVPGLTDYQYTLSEDSKLYESDLNESISKGLISFQIQNGYTTVSPSLGTDGVAIQYSFYIIRGTVESEYYEVNLDNAEGVLYVDRLDLHISWTKTNFEYTETNGEPPEFQIFTERIIDGKQEILPPEHYSAQWYSVGTDGQNTPITDPDYQFGNGQYILRLELTTPDSQNYKWIEGSVDADISNSGNFTDNVIEIVFEITYPTINLTLVLPESLEYGFTLEEFKDDLTAESFSGIIDEELRGQIDNLIQQGKYTVEFRADGNLVTDPLDLDSGSKYSVRVVFGTVGTNYVIAETAADAGLSITPHNVEVSVISPVKKAAEYNNEDHTFSVDLNGKIPGFVPGNPGNENVLSWEFKVTGDNGINIEFTRSGVTSVEIVLHDAGTYKVTYTVTADNHSFTYSGDNKFTITISSAQPTLTFTDATQTGVNAQYNGTYSQFNFSDPEANANHGESDETPHWSFTYDGKPYDDWDKLMEQIQNARTYTVQYTVYSTNPQNNAHNYEAAGTLTFVIGVADMTSSIVFEGDSDDGNVDYTIGYDAETHKVTVSVTSGGSQLTDVDWKFTVVDDSDAEIATGDYTEDSFSFPVMNAGSYTLTFSAEKTNYSTITNNTQTITVNQAGSSVNLNFNHDSDGLDGADSFSYQYGMVYNMSGTPDSSVDDQNADWKWSITVDGYTDEEFHKFTELCTFFDNENRGVGDYKVNITLYDSKGNHSECYVSFTVHVMKKPLSLNLGLEESDSPLLTFGDAAPDADEYVDGFVYEQNFTEVFGNEKHVSINYTQWDPAGTRNESGQDYLIDGTELMAKNYSTENLESAFTVAKFHVDLEIESISTQYMQTRDGPTVTIVTDLPEDMEEKHGPIYKLMYSIDGDSSDTDSLDEAIGHVGTHTIIAIPGSNYEVGFNDATLTVSKRTVIPSILDCEDPFRGTAYSIEEVKKACLGFTNPGNIPENEFKDFVNNIQITIEAMGDVQLVDGLPRNAGHYNVTVISPEDANLQVRLNAELTYTIIKLRYDVVNLWFDSTNSHTYDGTSHPYTLQLRTSVGNVDLTQGNWNILAYAGVDGEAPLTVTYYVDGEPFTDSEGNPAYPSFTDAKPDGESYEITVVLEGSPNYDVDSIQKMIDDTYTYTVLKATNYWYHDGDYVINWPKDFQYTDFDYSEIAGHTPVCEPDSKFGEVDVTFRVKQGDIFVEKKDGWIPDAMTPVGEYKVTVTVQGNDNYSGLEETYYFTVSKLGLTIKLQYETSMYDDGNPVNNNLIGYNPDLMEFHRETGDIEIGSDGTLTASELGDNIFYLELVHPESYEWTTSEDTRLSMNWELVTENVINHWKTIPSIDDWTYGEQPDDPVAEPQYGTVQFSYEKADGTPLESRPTDAGDYVLVAHVSEGTHETDGKYTGLESKVRFTIHAYRVAIPQMETITYTGKEITVPYVSPEKDFYNKKVQLYTVEGDPGTLIGDYKVTLTLTNTNNFVWQDDTTEPKEITWRIVSGGVPTYADFAIDDGDEVYTGHPIEKNVICHREGWTEGEHYTITHTNNVNVGTATVTVSGTAFDAATGESTPWSLTFTFEIVKATPVLDFVNEGFTSYEDNGTFELRPYLSDEADLSDLVWTSSDESVATVDENGIVTLRGLGTAEITATLPGSENWNEAHDSYELTVNETQTEIVVVPGPGGSGGSGDGGVIYIPTVIREDAGISDLTWLIILACVVVVMLALIWLLWNRRTE